MSTQGLQLPDQIIKRNGAIVTFDLGRVERAVQKCYDSLDTTDQRSVSDIVNSVANAIMAKFQGELPNVEAVQDIVEMALLQAGEFEAARHYIVYREAHAKNRALVPAEVQAAFADSAHYFPNQHQQFMYYDKYARFNWELGRRETWPETVDRVVDFLQKLSGGQLGYKVYDLIRQYILEMKVMPSMRLLSQAGPAAERNSMAIYNCSYLPVDSIESFKEAMLISLAGCGVGYSVEREHVEQLPRIRRQTGERSETWFVEDSAEGWGKAVECGLKSWFTGCDMDFDYSLIRPAGTPLLTKGGTASGPAPLKFVLEFLRDKVLSRQGSFLRTIDAHDMMCVVGGAAVSGGVRRTAMIALFDYDDTEMRTCKDGVKLDANPHRWNANNSAVWPEDITQIDIVEQFAEMYRNQRGEPGIFSRANANTTKPHRRAEAEFGSNPCVTGDTVIATVDGPRTFADLADSGKDILVYAWHPTTRLPVVRWMRRPHRTKRNTRVLEVEFDSGLVVQCTPDHHFYSFQGNKVQAKHLKVGKSVRAWSLNRHTDGHLRVHGWNREENKAAHQWVARMVWENAFGPITDSNTRIHHKDENKENNDISNLESMTVYEHNSHHYPARAAAGFDGHAANHKVVAIREAGYADVYNGCVDDAHTYIIVDPEPIVGPDNGTFMTGIVSANCGEINLRPFEFCNLSIAVARPDDTPITLKNKVEVATIIGTIQSLATTFPGMRPEWKANCEEERLLGVDISGQWDCPVLLQDDDGELLTWLRNTAVRTNIEYARKLGINHSAAITCCKPNGNSSQLLDCASGIHRRWSPYYIRNMRVSPFTPLYRVLRDAGVPMDPENGQNERNATSWVVHFPMKSPEGAMTRKGYTAVQQCEFWLQNKVFWTEHNPSVTITYQPDELLDLTNWVWQHRTVVGGMAFLPADDAQYDQMPYVEIDQDTYERLAAEFPVIDFSLLYAYEKEDMTEAAQTLACSAGQCEL